MATADLLDAPTIARSTLADRVYEQLLSMLLAGQVAAGDELNEVALAGRFAVSRTPVREALRRLAADGLVESGRNLRAVARRFSRQEIVETYEVRGILEAAAAAAAATIMTEEQLAELRRLCDAAPPPRGDRWGEGERGFDARLHEAIAAACGNARLRDEIARYTRLVRRVRSLSARNPRRLAAGHAEHEQLLQALEARDPAAAAETMRRHVQSALAAVLEELPAERLEQADRSPAR